MSNKSLAGEHNAQTILVTGGAGFIGSHTCVELLEQNYNVVILDDLSNSCVTAVDRIRELSGANADQLKFVEASILDREACERVFSENDIDAIIHFAGFKAVGESTQKPLEYYGNNLTSFMNVIGLMREFGRRNIVFSSSCTVYGEPEKQPVTEQTPRKPATSPYGNTKQMCEDILRDSLAAYPGMKGIALRYFNPIGAHPSALIGELPRGVPQNLVPFITQTAAGLRECLSVFGDDYPTPDGTGVRDFIHVMDLADGHAKAVPYIMNHTGWIAINLGCGRGYSVLEVVKAFETASDRSAPYELVDRREGDIAANWCDPARAERLLGWKASRTIDDMCRDAWNFESNKR